MSSEGGVLLSLGKEDLVIVAKGKIVRDKVQKRESIDCALTKRDLSKLNNK
jgi:hypothetical protein